MMLIIVVSKKMVKRLNHSSDVLALDQDQTKWTRVLFSFNLDAIYTLNDRIFGGLRPM